MVLIKVMFLYSGKMWVLCKLIPIQAPILSPASEFHRSAVAREIVYTEYQKFLQGL